jgi:putative ABC transport system permease protein
MRPMLLLAWRYVAHHRIRSLILVVCIALIAFLPLAVSALVERFETAMMARARSVPLVVGAKASRYDLLLSALYYKGRMKERLSMAEVGTLRADGLGAPVPVFVEHSARGYPVVGTTLDYFDRLERRFASGTPPLVLGDAVLGAGVAAELGLGPGDRILSDAEHLYDLSASYPLNMRVVGVLAPSESPDDRAVFVDIKTAWVIEGLCHGHQDVVKDVDPAAVFERTDDNVTVDNSIDEYQEITPENIDSFHFHGDPATFPITAVLVWPRTDKGRTLLKAHYGASRTAQILVPTAVVAELMGFLFKLKRFFDANVILVTLATGLFLTLIVLLSLRIRKRERETLFKIGCSRLTMFWLQSAELGMIVIAGVILAVVMSWGFFAYVVRYQGLI